MLKVNPHRGLSVSPAPEGHHGCTLSQALIFSWQWPWGSLSCNVAWFGKTCPFWGEESTIYVFRAGTLKTEAAVSIEKSINVPKCTCRIPEDINPLNAELNPICYLLALLAHHFLHVSRIRVKSLTLRQLMSYIYGAPILDVSRSHTTTQHSR